MDTSGTTELPFRNPDPFQNGYHSPKMNGHHTPCNGLSPEPNKQQAVVRRAERELHRYMALLKRNQSEQDDAATIHGLHVEDILGTPIFSWNVKLALADERKSGRAPDTAHFNQFALFGQERNSPAGIQPIFLNTNAPWSAFLCGSQGSGKSHTLSVMLEGCLLPKKSLGRLPNPLQGIVFHADSWAAGGAGGVCEAAHLCSAGIPVTVLVSPSNYWRLQAAYSSIPDPDGCLQVKALKLKPRHLNVERMLALMAFNEPNGKVPLYMEVINKILRGMATSAQHTFDFDYRHFMNLLELERLTADQKGPMNLRLQLLESFMDDTKSHSVVGSTDVFSPPAGSLTIVDLTDPFIDPSTACTLFDICLALFLENRPASISNGTTTALPASRIVALDEAHKYLSAGSATADRFTDSLLTAIRLQRHAAVRVVVATQEPTVSPRLLDLCSLTVVHRFTSPVWFNALRDHLAGLSALAGRRDDDMRALFEEIVTLGVGESLVFAPSAMVRLRCGDGSDDDDGDVDAGDDSRRTARIVKLGTECLRFRARPRLTSDGGKSVLAIR